MARTPRTATTLLALSCLASFLSAAPARADDGAYRELAPPYRSAPAGMYDPLRDRYLVVGGRAPQGGWGGVWTLDPSLTQAWQPLAASGVPNTAYGGSVLYDAARDRMLVVGDRQADGSPAPEVWAMTLGSSPAWSLVATTAGGPTDRVGMSAIYDPVGDRVICFGGTGPHPTLGTVTWNETWALTLAGTPTWQLLSPVDSIPPIGTDLPAAYDATQRRMLLWNSGRVWALDLAGPPAWHVVSQAFTPPLLQEVDGLFYDAPNHRALLEIVNSTGTSNFEQTWAATLDGGAFAQLPTGVAGEILRPALWLDPARSRLMMFGGDKRSPGNGPYHTSGETWWFDLAQNAGWADAPPPVTGPAARARAFAVRDPLQPRMLFYGGSDLLQAYPDPAQYDLAGLGGWAPFPAANGSPLPPAGTTPLALDPRRKQLVAPATGDFQHVWIHDLATAAWSMKTATNAPTSDFHPQVGVVDSLGDRLLVIGDGLDPTFQVRVDAVWALPLGVASPTWSLLTPTGGPPLFTAGGGSPVALYDAPRARVLFFGWGTEVWQLGLSGTPQWTQLANLPTFFYAPTLGYDRGNDRVLIFYADRSLVGQTWLYAWPLGGPPSSAVKLAPTGVTPASGQSWCGAMDAATGRLVLVGGPEGFFDYRVGASSPPPLGFVGCPGDFEWTPGTPLPLVFQLGPLAAGGTIDYTLTSQRAWPGFPVTGAADLAAGEVLSLPVTVAVPDTATAGQNRLRLTGTVRGPGTVEACDAVLSAPPPPPVVTVAATCPPSVTWIAGGVARGRFRVSVAGTAATTLDWQLNSTRAWPGFPVVGSAAISGGGAAFDVDVTVPDTVAAGANPLTIVARPSGESAADSCTWTISGSAAGSPPPSEFAVSIAPNPAMGPIVLRLSLTHDTTVHAEIRTLTTGRVVRRKDYGRLPTGVYALDLVPDDSLPMGMYVVRLLLDGFSRTQKLVVVR